MDKANIYSNKKKTNLISRNDIKHCRNRLLDKGLLLLSGLYTDKWLMMNICRTWLNNKYVNFFAWMHAKLHVLFYVFKLHKYQFYIFPINWTQYSKVIIIFYTRISFCIDANRYFWQVNMMLVFFQTETIKYYT